MMPGLQHVVLRKGLPGRSSKSRGLTILELAVLISILLILATLAGPAHDEAVTRAKVARAHSDLRTLAIAVDVMALETGGDYPVKLFPTVYMPCLPGDVFATREGTGSVAAYTPYHYYYPKRLDWVRGTPHEYLWTQVAELAGGYVLFSVGPDQCIGNTPGEIQQGSLGTVFRDYDPTNGTLSPGNIFRTPANPAGLGVRAVFYRE